MLALAVPTKLGGHGATVRETALVVRELAHHCGSTALALAMHHHLTAAAAIRHRQGVPGSDRLLRRIADENIVLATSGASDFTRPRGNATRAEGGYRVSGRKRFASQSPAATLLATMFPIEDPDDGLRVLNVMMPLTSRGVRVEDNWDALGMRGSGSNDVTIDDVFVADEDVVAVRPYGVLDPPLQVASIVGGSMISAVYLGIAESAAVAAVDVVRGSTRADDQLVVRLVGLLRTRLRIATWALDGVLNVVSDTFEPSMDLLAAVMAAKGEVARAGMDVCDLAMEVAGGSAFFRGSVIERAYRDIRAAKFHQLQPEASLLHAGRVSLGLPCDEV